MHGPLATVSQIFSHTVTEQSHSGQRGCCIPLASRSGVVPAVYNLSGLQLIQPFLPSGQHCLSHQLRTQAGAAATRMGADQGDPAGIQTDLQKTRRLVFRIGDGSMIAIDTIAVENEVVDNMYQRSELDWLIYNKPLEYAQLVLGGDLEQYVQGRPEHRLTN